VSLQPATQADKHVSAGQRATTPQPHLVFLYPQLKKLTGAQRLILMLAKWTTRLGGRATLITHRLTPEVRAALDPAVVLIETGQRVDRFGQHYLDAALEYLTAPALRAAIPADADGLIFFGPPSLPALWLARHDRSEDRPLLYFCYEPPRAAYSDRQLIAGKFGPLAPLVALAARLYRPLDRRFVRSADAALANGMYGQRLIRDAYDVEATILPHGVDLTPPTAGAIAAARDRWGIAGQEAVALTVNQLHPRKRIELAIRAIAAARAAGQRVRLLIVGNGVERPTLEAEALALGLGDVVTFCGFVPDDELPALYAACDLYIHTTLAESFGLSLLEAAASGLPAVAVADGGPLEILRDGETGLLVPPTVEELAAGIGALVADPDAARALGQRARADVLARYRWEAGAAQLLSVYARVKQEARRGVKDEVQRTKYE
jgi:glycosyltransferase involved in cell wall biosynthesis